MSEFDSKASLPSLTQAGRARLMNRYAQGILQDNRFNLYMYYLCEAILERADGRPLRTVGEAWLVVCGKTHHNYNSDSHQKTFARVLKEIVPLMTAETA